MVYKTLIFVFSTFVGVSFVSGSPGQTGERGELPQITESDLRRAHIRPSHEYRFSSCCGLIALRDNFSQRVKAWEDLNKRRMLCLDLLSPYLSPDKKLTRLNLTHLSEFTEDSCVLAVREWTPVGEVFGGYSSLWKHLSHYDRLFGFQVMMECFLLGDSKLSTFLTIQIKKDFEYSRPTGATSRGIIFNIDSTGSSHWIMKEKRALDRPGNSALVDYKRIKNLPGLVPDVPIHAEGFLGKIVRRIIGIPPPEAPPIPSLPTSKETDIFGYSHELPPIGLSAWLHLCRPCRRLCEPLTAYGVKAEDTVGFPFKRFVQPPYELPVSVFEEEAAMVAGTDVGAAAAAASSGATTPRDVALHPALRPAPAAAASASCADIPHESDDARETDHLLGGTGSYVRHRAAAMAAAAAVEKEVHTSSS